MNTQIQQEQLPFDPLRPDRKPYAAPAILHELALETRAGSTFGADPSAGLIDEMLGISTK